MENNIIYPNDFLNKKRTIKKNTCFIIMPFDKSSNEVYETIKRATNFCNIDCERSDELKRSSPFINKVLSSINTSYFLIVDISGLNPNVFYELGIAHTLRAVSRVLILKDSATDCPSDLKHFNYFSYNKGEYSKLYDTVVNFIRNNNSLDDLSELLALFNLIPDEKDLNEILQDVKNNLSGNTSTLTGVLNNSFGELSKEEIYELMDNLHDRFFSFNENSKDSVKYFYVNLLKHLLPKLLKNYDIERFINAYFIDNTALENKFILDLQCEISTSLLQIKPFDCVYKWIKSYLMKCFPAHINVTKYKLHIALLDSKLPETEKFLIDNLTENIEKLESKPVRSLVEHSLNICKEKEIHSAIPVAIKYIETTNDEFIFRSAVDLITQLGSAEQIIELLKISNDRNELIEKSSFLIDHIKAANEKIKSYI